MVNGSSFRFFRSSRGLRQGDSLFPYFFVIGMEALSYLIAKAVEGGFLFGYRIRGREGDGLTVSHLLYVDDTILFCQPKRGQMAYLSWLLMWFKAILVLEINLAKIEIILVGGVINMEIIASELRCKIWALPSSYLGLPLGAQHNLMAVWDIIEERFRRKLTLWKRQYISTGRRPNLLRNTLSSLPICYMSLFRLLRKIKVRLE